MRKLLIVTHGELAKGAGQTLTLFLGKDQPFHTISAYVDETKLKDQLDAFMKTVADDDQLVIFTDIMGGSVNQEMLSFLQRPDTFLFTGTNLAMLIAASCLPPQADIEDFRRIAQEGKDAVVLMNDYAFATALEEGDE